MRTLRQRLDNSATFWKIKVASGVFVEKAAEQLYCLCHSPKDMTSRDIAGLRVGMSQEAASKVVASLRGVEHCEERRTGSRVNREKQRLRAIYVDFQDDRFLHVGFSETNCGNHVSEIWLVYQDRSFAVDSFQKTIANYGLPDFERKNSGVLQAAWGGRATDQGAIVPYKGVCTTLSAEQINNRQLSLGLVAHNLIAEQV